MAVVQNLNAGTAQALLAGFQGIGLDAQALARRCGLLDLEREPFDAPLSGGVFGALWREAFTLRPEPELPTRVGLAVPLGAFSTVDYLARSSPRVDAAFEALSTWFRQVAREFRVEVSSSASGGLVALPPHGDFEGREVSDEFTLAVMAGRFRAATRDPVVPTVVRLSRPPPAQPSLHAHLFGAPVHFGASVSALEWSPEAWSAPLLSADAGLQKTLESLAQRLELGPDLGVLESALRARLRNLLPEGEVSAATAAKTLGLSERTLQRRLQDEGTSFRAVLDGFREAEAERLVLGGRWPLSEVALKLGFSDQTAWNRAFRRWKGQSPTEWAQAQRAASRR
jgi:AraC-like DNA-binding protein